MAYSKNKQLNIIERGNNKKEEILFHQARHQLYLFFYDKPSKKDGISGKSRPPYLKTHG